LAARPSNQDIERHYFEKFRQDFPLPKGEITYGDKPDVIVDGEKRIGIEITRFFLGDGSLEGSEQVQRDKRDKVVSLAREIYTRNKGKSFELSFSFNKASPINSVRQLAVRVAALAKSLEVHPGGTVDEDTFRDIPELSFVHLDLREYQDPTWHVVQVHLGPGVMSEERLRDIIHRKEEDAKSYKPCDLYWLLLIVDSFDRAQEQEIRTDGMGTIESQTFGKVIIYETPFGNTVDVK
jgi:hypothetical protein